MPALQTSPVPSLHSWVRRRWSFFREARGASRPVPPTEADKAHTTDICTHASSLTPKPRTAKSQGAGRIRITDVQPPCTERFRYLVKVTMHSGDKPRVPSQLCSQTILPLRVCVEGPTNRDRPTEAGPEVELVTILPTLPSKKPPLTESTRQPGSLWE